MLLRPNPIKPTPAMNLKNGYSYRSPCGGKLCTQPAIRYFYCIVSIHYLHGLRLQGILTKIILSHTITIANTSFCRAKREICEWIQLMLKSCKRCSKHALFISVACYSYYKQQSLVLTPGSKCECVCGIIDTRAVTLTSFTPFRLMIYLTKFNV